MKLIMHSGSPKVDRIHFTMIQVTAIYGLVLQKISGKSFGRLSGDPRNIHCDCKIQDRFIQAS